LNESEINLHIINLTYYRVELKVVPDDDAQIAERRLGSNDKRVGGRPASGNFPSVMATAESLEKNPQMKWLHITATALKGNGEKNYIKTHLIKITILFLRWL
jgi:hypothetical protein